MNILQVSSFDVFGGAAKIAWNLFQSYRARGHPAWLAVGNRQSDDPDVLQVLNDVCRSSWARLWIRMGHLLSPLAGRVQGAGMVSRLMAYHIGQTRRWLEVRCGHEDFDFPASRYVLDIPSARPDVLHCHNLHGRYFDLRVLPWLSRQIPVILTLHDSWLLTGHCSHSFDCQRWKTGCGDCPDLTIYPAIQRDGTSYNWRRKRNIYADSKVFVTTPSYWLMRKVEQSMLAPGILEAKVIPNGVDLSLFHPADSQWARKTLGISKDARVLLFMAKGKRQNIWEDYHTMRDAVARASERLPGQKLQLLVLGRDGAPEQISGAAVHFVPYQKRPKSVALYYDAADIYVHAARADTFPNTVLEALACGTPVVATAVGGVPEQVKGARMAAWEVDDGGPNKFGIDEATGILVTAGDVTEMARSIELLLGDETLRHRLGRNAARDAAERFDLNRQAEAYLHWYQTILERHPPNCSAPRF